MNLFESMCFLFLRTISVSHPLIGIHSFFFCDMKNLLSEVCTEEIRLKKFPGNRFAYHVIRPSNHPFIMKITKFWLENSTIKFPKESDSSFDSTPSELLQSGNHSQ